MSTCTCNQCVGSSVGDSFAAVLDASMGVAEWVLTALALFVVGLLLSPLWVPLWLWRKWKTSPYRERNR